MTLLVARLLAKTALSLCIIIIMCMLLLHSTVVEANSSPLDNVRQRFRLKENAMLSTQYLTKDHHGTTFDSDTIFTTTEGTDYHLKDAVDLFPLSNMFSPSTHEFLPDGTMTSKITGDILPISVFRGIFADGTIVQFSQEEHQIIDHVEIHQKSKPVTYLIKNNNENENQDQEDDDGSYLTFVGTDMDAENFGTDAIPVPGRENRHHGRNLRSTPPRLHNNQDSSSTFSRNLLHYVRGDNSNQECLEFKTIKVAIAYDEDFCQLYEGSKARSEARIQSIVAGASMYFENDICFKLVLTNIIPPLSCNPQTSVEYQYMNRENPCTIKEDPHYLFQFSEYMRDLRNDVGVDEDATVHVFTGFEPQTEALGCTYIGAYCDRKWAYGVNYMSFSTDNVAPQALVFAHELAHTLGAEHDAPDETTSFVMTPFVTSGEQGFSPSSIHEVFTYLDKVTCDLTMSAHDYLQVTSTILLDDTKVYIFFVRAGTAFYSRFDLDVGSVGSSSYPRPVTGYWDNWLDPTWYPTGGFIGGADDKTVYFLKDNTYVRFDLEEQRIVDDVPQPINFIGLPNVEYAGAVLFPEFNSGNRYLYLFDKHGNYYRYETNTQVASLGYPKPIQENWPNWPSGFQPTSGYTTNGKAYIFGTMHNDFEPLYIRYDIEDGRVDDYYPKSVRDHYPGVFQ